MAAVLIETRDAEGTPVPAALSGWAQRSSGVPIAVWTAGGESALLEILDRHNPSVEIGELAVAADLMRVDHGAAGGGALERDDVAAAEIRDLVGGGGPGWWVWPWWPWPDRSDSWG